MHTMDSQKLILPAVAVFTLMLSALDARAETSAKDKLFVTKAGHAGHAEVGAGRLAQAKSTNAEVKKFGAQMVEDHSAAGAELKKIADSKGLATPTEPDAAQKAQTAKLESLPAASFDRMYVDQAGVADHKAAVELFSDEAANGSDPELKAFAQKTLPTIKHHYEMALTLSKSLK